VPKLPAPVVAWKVASGELNNEPMFVAMAASRLPIILSSGMSSMAEIDAAVARVKAVGLPVTLLQCTSLYPTPPEKVGLNLIPYFRDRYDCPVGLSDHSGTIYPGLAAATLGIDVLEVHVALSREMFGPDVPASITPTELRQLVDGIRFIETMRANPIDKNVMGESLAPMRDLFTKSVVARFDLPAGTVLRESHLAVKKPGTGFPAAQIVDLFGRTLARPVLADQMLKPSDLV
jgi:N-acetylneuraminate synthase